MMKRIVVSLFLIFSVHFSWAQDKLTGPNIGLKWSPAGITLGSLNLHAEYNFGKNSLTAKIGIPLATHHDLMYDGREASFKMRATSFLAGYRTYLSKKHMRGLYFEPYFKYVHHSSEGVGTALLAGETVSMDFTNDYNGVGLGAQLGVQFMLSNKFLIDFFFLGPEINSSRNNFSAMELTNTLAWSSGQAGEAEQDIRDFINKFPIIGHKVNVMVDQKNKTVRADFKGTIPGYRIGVSFGFAF